MTIETFDADLSDLKHVQRMVAALKSRHDKLDVIVNNAGVFKVNQTITEDGMDVRFVVNMIAPYLITTSLHHYITITNAWSKQQSRQFIIGCTSTG